MTIAMLIFAATLTSAPVEGAKGHIGVRIDGLRPVRLTVGDPSLRGLVPSHDQSATMSGLSNADRDQLRGRLEALVRGELTAGGFQVVEPGTEGVPLFVVSAESRMLESDRGPYLVETSVEVDEPGVWVRDPTKKGLIVVWRMAQAQAVTRKNVAKAIEAFVLGGVQTFTSAQAPPSITRE